MEAQRLKILFTRHLEEELNESEHLELLQLINSPDAINILDEPLNSLWKQALLEKGNEGGTETRIRQVMERVNKPRRTVLLRRLWWIPAAVIFLTTFTILFKPFSRRSAGERHLQHFSAITTTARQKKMIRLPDGSMIHLNSGSSIRYADDYNYRLRKVWLQGEAFFQVTKNPGKPFIVEFSGLYTRVLGTSFNVDAYPENRQLQVAVSSGKVEVGKINNVSKKDASLAVLNPGRKLSYQVADGIIHLSELEDVAAIGDWKQGVIRFKGEDFTQVASRLEKWYGVKFRFENIALKKCRFRGTFKELSLEKVLTLLQKSSGFSFHIDKQQVYIKGKGCL